MDKYLWLFFVIIQQIFILIYLKKFIIFDENIVVDSTVLIFDFLLMIYIYVASHIRKSNDVFLKKIIIFVSIMIWQHLFVINLNLFWYKISVLMQPMVTYIFVVENFNLILYDNIKFKSKVDFIIKIILFSLFILFFINIRLFNLIYFILFIGLHFYPILIMLFFKNYFNKILSKVKKDCLIFSLFLVIVLCFNFIGSAILTEDMYSNLGWYITTATICIITYIRLIHNILFIKVKGIFSKITSFIFTVVFLLIIFWVILLYKNIAQIKYVLLSIGISELFIFKIIFFIRIYFEYIEYVHFKDFDSIRFSNIRGEEKIKEKFAQYLHDDILQSIIAIKNISQVSLNSSENKEIIVFELNNLIENIRNEIDTQKPIIYENESIKLVYQELIDNLLKRYKSNKKVEFYCIDDIVIYLPYSSIVYRLIKELVTNGIKHSEGYIIKIYLDVEFDNINLKIKNLTNNKEIKIGNGLDNVIRNIKFLKGKIEYYIDEKNEEKNFCVDIKIPMERRIFFEDIID